MKCLSFRLIQVRNFKDRTIEPSPSLTFFTGPNGCGKTNLLEALYYSSVGKSFRTSNDGELIRIGDDEGTIFVNFSVHQVEQAIKIRLTRGQGKKIFLNDTPIRRKELMAFFGLSFLRRTSFSSLKGHPSCAAGSLTWKFPRCPRGTMKNSYGTAGRCSRETGPSKMPGPPEGSRTWICGICRLPPALPIW